MAATVQANYVTSSSLLSFDNQSTSRKTIFHYLYTTKAVDELVNDIISPSGIVMEIDTVSSIRLDDHLNVSIGEALLDPGHNTRRSSSGI